MTKITALAAEVAIEAAPVDVGDVLARSAVPKSALVVIRAVRHVHDLTTLGVLPVQSRVLDSLHLRQYDAISRMKKNRDRLILRPAEASSQRSNVGKEACDGFLTL